jgi:hypothetical protein
MRRFNKAWNKAWRPSQFPITEKQFERIRQTGRHLKKSVAFCRIEWCDHYEMRARSRERGRRLCVNAW